MGRNGKCAHLPQPNARDIAPSTTQWRIWLVDCSRHCCPELWTECYHCPTWLDYLRHRNRSTQPERDLDGQAKAFHIGPESVRVRCMLQRSSESALDRAAIEALPTNWKH
ncbi:MFS transporter [Bradyrhizobium sp. ma5]|uniref:MFS transporter n=1 Tax=Bradyrhizobium sp. ma5 TaxID=3344828 RepID=UPI0035D51D8D